MSICREIRSRSCGRVWSIAFSVTKPSTLGWMSICSRASRASAKSRSWARTFCTTTLYTSGRTAGFGFGSAGTACTSGGMVPVCGVASVASRCCGDGFIGAGAQLASNAASSGRQVRVSVAVFRRIVSDTCQAYHNYNIRKEI